MAVLSYFRRGISPTFSLLVICLFTILNLEWIQASKNVTCHPQCVCVNSTVDCSNKALNSLPKNLPSNSSVLLLNQNNIKTLSPQLLSHLPSLNKINLSDNPINCNCSLSWILNASINLQIVGKCNNPVAVKGKAITSLTIHEMCDLTLTTTESPVVKFEKETVNLNCQPSLLASVQWSRKSDGSPDVTSVKTLGSRFRVLDNGTLVIATLQSTDQGEYTCIVEHKYGARANKSVFLKVKEPFVTVKPSNIKLVEGENGTSDCVASGDSKIMWKYGDDGGDLDSNHFKVLSGTLVLSNAQTKHSGKYVCVLASDTTINATVTIDVQAICKIDAVSGSNMPTINSTKRHYVANDVIALSCADGYILNGSSVLKCRTSGTWSSKIFPKCQDNDECKTNMYKCDGNATCLNTMGSYKCICSTGYQEKGKSCEDNDECKTNMYKCDGNATCRNTMGSYKCICNTGYQGNGTSCKEMSVPPATSVMPTDKNVTQMTTMAPIRRTDLTNLIETTNGTQPNNAKSIRRTLEMLEELVYRVKNSDSKKTKNFLHVASNLMGKQNHATWAKVQQTSPGVERLLRAVNEVMKLQAMEMLKIHGNRTESFSETFYNLDAEILVDIGEIMAKKRIILPRSTKDDYMEFPTSIFQKFAKQPVAVIVFSFKQLDKLLPKRSLISDFDSFGTDSHVLSGSIISLSGTLSTPVTITFKNKDVGDTKMERTECVFWKYDEAVENVDGKSYLNNLNVSKGGWSGEGCNVSSRNKSSTTCQCDHLTDFVVLTSKAKILEIVDPSVVIYIGSVFLLIAALIAFIRNVVVWCQTKQERLLVLINECLAIVLMVIVFLVGVLVDYQETLCVALGALMHWLVLSVFFWILVEEIQLYLAVRFGWSRSSSRLKYFILLGWVIPAIIVGVVLAITQLNEYGSTQWCWYNNSLTLFLSYICPIVLCLLMCLIVILRITSLKALMTDNTDKKDVSIILALSGLLIPLVAVTCITAAFCAHQPEKDVFQYLFIVFCIILGIYILYYHCWLDREITKMSVRSNKRVRPKRDYYSTKETVLYSPGSSEGKSFSLIFPSRKSPSHGKKTSKSDAKRSKKRSDSATPFDYDSNVPMYPSINDSSLKSFRSQVSTQQHTLDNPPNTLSAITISRPNSQCIELTSLSDLERRPDGAEQTDAADHSEFYGPRNSNPLDKVRQRTSGSSDVLTATNASTFGKDSGKPVQRSSDTPSNTEEEENRISTTSSAGISRSSLSGASINAGESEMTLNEDGLEKEPFLRSETNRGPEVRSDPPAKIPKRRTKGSRRRLDDEVREAEETEEPKLKAKQKSSSLPSNEGSVELKQYTGF